MATSSEPQRLAQSNGPRARILVVDDDNAVRRTLTELFRRMGYDATEAATGEAALEQIATQALDLVVLDLRLPHMEGTTILQQACKLCPDTVFIILTGYGSLDSAIVAIRHGAFDYLLKPSSTDEIARAVEAGLEERRRRLQHEEPVELLEKALASLRDSTERAQPAAPPKRFLQVADVTVDNLRRLVVVRGEPVDLTPTEFDILAYLMLHKDRVVSCRELAGQVRGYDLDERDARVLLRTHIHRLRGKLETGPEAPQVIVTVRGSGYAISTAATPS
jgi:DNA-binding response OmpR family regulator